MMEGLGFRPYEAYKDSRVDWIGSIPSTWDVQRAKWLFKRMDRGVRPEDDIVTCFRDGEVTLRSNRRTEGFTTALKEIGYQGIRKGDLVIHAMDAFAGAIGVSDSDGKATPVYSACVPRQPNTVDPTFYAYYMRHLALSGFLVSLAKGIRERSTDFRFNDFAELEIPFPCLSEQRAIAAFLDDKCAKIDGAVKIKEYQIALLRERRQIIIQDAVTRGLNPAAPMKDSGIDWIGQIPAHWKLKKLKYASSALRTGRTPPTDSSIDYFDDGTVCWYTPGDFKEDGEFQGAEKLISPKAEKAGFVDIYPENSVYFVGIGGTLGRVNISRVKASCNQQFNVILPSEETAPELVLFWLMANRESIYYLTDFSTMPIRNQSQTKNIPIPCPPDFEQKQIVGFIQNTIVEIRQVISIKQDQIAALKEYKTSLINAAVTGKIKVI